MADFTERLPLTEGTNRVIADEANPSAFKPLMEFASEALTGYQQIKQDVAKNKARKKAEDERATQAQIAYDVTGANDAARQIVTQSGAVRAQGQQILNDDLNVQMDYMSREVDRQGSEFDTLQDKSSLFYTPPADITPEMEREVSASASRAASVVAAVEQGRMPEISMNAALSARFRQLREKYPQHTEYLLDTWKKAGLDANLFSEARDAAFEVADARTAANKARDAKLEMRNKAISLGRETLGAAALGVGDDQLEITGLETMRISGELDRAVQRADLQGRLAAGNQAAATAAQEELTDSVNTNMAVAVYNQSLPIIRTIGGLVDSLSRNPNDADSLMEFQRTGPMVNQLVNQVVNNAVNQAIAIPGYKGDPEKLRATLTAQFKGLTDAFTGDQSVVQSNINGLKAVETAFAIDGHKALPVFMGLKQLGIKPDAMPGLMRAVETNPTLQKQLNAEVNGYLSDWGRDRASTSLVNVVKLLRGETTFARMDAAAARNAIGGLTAATDKIASDYVAGKDIDPDMVLNGFGEIVIAATALTPSSGANPIYVATRGFADAGSRAALIKALGDPKLGTEDREMALATVQASRAGSAHLLNNILLASGKANEASPYFKMVWDSRDGKYKVDKSNLNRAIAQARSNAGSLRGAGAGLETGNRRLGVLLNMKEPEVLTKLIRAANLNLDNAIALGPHDPSTPKATENQLRNWYGRNIPIPGEKDAAKPINANKELGKQIEGLRAMTTQVFDASTKPVKVPPKARDYTKAPRYAELAPVVQSAASKYGVPANIALALIGKESTFDPTAAGPVIQRGTHKGDRAMGLGQVMAKTAAAYGVTDRASLTPDQQADLSMRVLADNYKSAGNWRDAVSMYFTGVKYATAAANPEKYNDGANTVDQYLGDIL